MSKRMTLRRRFLAFLFAGLTAACSLATAQDSFRGVQRIVAIGDIHGDFDQLVGLLRAAELIDARNKWTGGKSHLVQTGDMLDRGPDSQKVMKLLIELEPEAKKAGGAIHVLIGNHEAMNIYGDLRYVPASEYASYVTPKSEQLRDELFRVAARDRRRKGGAAPSDDDQFRNTFFAEHPLGWVEQRQAFAPDGVYGKWLRQHKAIIKINDAIFLHGGIGPKYASTSIGEINERIQGELEDFKKLDGGVAKDPDGPLWYRGLAQLPEGDLAGHVDQVLKTHGVRHIVIGHTPIPVVLPRFGGKVITIDVGLSKVYGGPPALLIIEDSKYYALHRGQRLELPVDGGDTLSYLKAAAALDPQPSPLQKLIGEKAGMATNGK
jgi:hypothetical protein